jgi:hypothetical protein
MGQRSVAIPRRVSTELSGDGEGLEGRFKGVNGAGVTDTGEVPKESAAMTS